MNRAAFICLVAVTSACVVTPLDPLPGALRAANDGDLLRALAYLDQVPPAHPNFVEVRALALAVETRIAESQRCLAEGLQQRAAGHEIAAVASLQRACELWPRAIGVRDLLAAARTAAASAVPESVSSAPQANPKPAPRPDSEPQVGAVAGPVRPSLPAAAATTPVDVPEPPSVVLESVQTSTIAHRSTTAERVSGDRLSKAPPPAVSEPPVAEQPSGVAAHAAPPKDAQALPTELAALRVLINGRDQGRAIAQLSIAHEKHPENSEIRDWLARLLQQRALVAYGRGWLSSAIEDWERVVDLTPDDQAAKSHLRVARAELAQRRGREERRKNAGG